MRPKSIVNFERVVLLSILARIVSDWINWDKTQAVMAEAQAQAGRVMFGANFAIGVQVVMILVFLLLLWLIARKGSPIAKWIYVVFVLIGLVAGIVGLRQTIAWGPLPLAVAVLEYLLSLFSLWLLFQPDSKAWFGEGRGPDPEGF